VDLILEKDDTLYPFEFKLTTNPTRRDGSGITAFKAAYPDRRIGMGAIICAVERPRWVMENILAIPWNLL